MIRLLLITGGTSSEHEISRASCTSIYNEIDQVKYEVKVAGIDKDGNWYELNEKIYDFKNDNWLDGSEEIKNTLKYLKKYDVVFPVLHGKKGEDGVLQGMLEMINIPYVGCKVFASALAMDKVLIKKMLKGFGINTVPSISIKKIANDKYILSSGKTIQLKNIKDLVLKNIGLPCFIKASRSGSSFGCYKVSDKSNIINKIIEASKYDSKILIEPALNITEIECAILENNNDLITGVGKIIPGGDYYSYDSKYNNKKSKLVIPADISLELEKKIQNISKKIFRIIDAKGLARCDFFLQKDTQKIYFNEINTMPGFTAISMYPKILNYKGISTQNLIDKLINNALENNI